MSKRIYRPSVRIANWFEDIILEEDTLKQFMDMRDKGELLIQKTYNLTQAVNTQLDLSISQDYALHIGDHIMVKCLGAKDQQKYWRDVNPRQDCVVALNVTDPFALLKKLVTGPVTATGCKSIAPTQRTVFRIDSTDGGLEGYKLRYGEPFCLHTVGENTGKLYLHSDRVFLQNCAKKSRHQVVSLKPEKTYLTQWMLQHKNPLRRLEFEHEPVEANDEVIMVHCKTGRCLAVEQLYDMRTPFGHEYELSAHTYLDSHKAEEDNNRWIFVVGVPGSKVNPVPEQGPGPAPLNSLPQ